jgi:hypothetical protein
MALFLFIRRTFARPSAITSITTPTNRNSLLIKKLIVEIFKFDFYLLKIIPILAIRFLRAKNRIKS